MIREYAVDPSVICRSLDTLQRFFSDFGADKGRVIGAVPGKWKERIFQGINNLGLGAVAKNKAKDRVNILEGSSLVKRAVDGRVEDVDWLAKVIDSHKECKFSAILSSCREEALDVYDYGNLLEYTPPCWDIGQTLSVPRNANDLTSAISFSLSIANAPVHFVDPYFDPRDDRYLQPMRSFIGIVNRGRFGMNKIFIHTQLKLDGTKSPKTREEIERGLNERLLGQLPDGFTVELWVWPNARLHDRFVLTKQVGYAFGHGLSEAAYQGATHVNINRLSENERARLFREISTKAGIDGYPIVIYG